MKNLNLVLFFLILSNLSFAQYSLTVEFNGMRNSNGTILYELFDESRKSIKVGTIDIISNKSRVVFNNLKSAKYALNFIHDENMNKKLDTKMLMIPKEGFGYSNNPVVKFGPPPFEKWIFEVNGNTKITCIATYLDY